MFEPQNRYVTCGIDERLPQELQRLIWTSVDMRVLLANEKIDYLQVFTFKKIDDEVLALHHEQEQPPDIERALHQLPPRIRRNPTRKNLRNRRRRP